MDYNSLAPPTTVIKIMNLVEPEQAKLFTSREYSKVLDDIVLECSQVVKEIGHAFIIRNHNSKIGAETGSVFMRVKTKEDAVELIKGMRGKVYEGRKFRMVCIPEATFQQHFMNLEV